MRNEQIPLSAANCIPGEPVKTTISDEVRGIQYGVNEIETSTRIILAKLKGEGNELKHAPEEPTCITDHLIRIRNQVDTLAVLLNIIENSI